MRKPEIDQDPTIVDVLRATNLQELNTMESIAAAIDKLSEIVQQHESTLSVEDWPTFDWFTRSFGHLIAARDAVRQAIEFRDAKQR